MSVPSTYDTDFRYRELTGVTDMQTVLDAVVDELTAQLPAVSRWTSLGGGEYKVPAQDPTGANRFMTVILARISATRLKLLVKDKSGTTVYDGRIDFTASCTARIFTGPRHLVVEVEYGALVFESAFAVMVDPAPFALSSLDKYVVAYARRDSAGTQVGTDVADEAVMNDNLIGSGPIGRIAMFHGTLQGGLTSGGSEVVFPAEILVQYAGPQNRGAGKLYQFAVVPSTVSPAVVKTCLLDQGVAGEFHVLGKAARASTHSSGKLAIRRA